jgi:hypothetical protein
MGEVEARKKGRNNRTVRKIHWILKGMSSLNTFGRRRQIPGNPVPDEQSTSRLALSEGFQDAIKFAVPVELVS